MQRDTRLARRALLVAGAVLAALGLTATAALADDWGQRVPGKHVYDLAGALTPAQVTDLEQSAVAVDRAGAPTVVYLRRKDADDATTRQDARALVSAWGVETSPGQQDGFVLLFNLRTANIQHGSAALVAGASHVARLDDGRLQGIYDGTMKPKLAAGDLAGALSAALAQVAADLTAPAPANSAPPQQSTSPGAVAGGLLGLGVVIAAVLGFGLLIARGGGFGNRPPGSGSGGRGGVQPWYMGGGGSSFTDTSSGSSTYTGGDGGASGGSSSGGGSF